MQLRTLKKTAPDPILGGFSLQIGVQNRSKIYVKGCWKNDEKMMMTRIAKKLDIGGDDGIRHHDFGARGGGRRRGKPLLQDRLEEIL
jgi:hypothetical protein